MNVTVGSIATFGMRRWDNLLISRYFGPGVMGAYNYAYNLADTPATAIGDQMSDIVAASFPHVDQRRRAQALVHSCTMVSLVMFPLSIGLAAVAPTVVDAFFDPRWSNVGTMLMCLSALSAARPLATILGSYFCALGRPGVVLRLEWAHSVVPHRRTRHRGARRHSLGMFVRRRRVRPSHVGGNVDGAAGRMASGCPRSSGRWRDRSRPAFVMAAGVSAARLALAGLTPPIQLLLEVGLGAAIYTGCARCSIARSSCHELLRTVRSALRNGSMSLPAAAEEKPVRPPDVLSLSTEFPNPSEPGKGLFVRARLEAIRSRACVLVVAPVASLDYANPQRNLFAASAHPARSGRRVAYTSCTLAGLYPPSGGWTNAFFLFARLLPVLAQAPGAATAST